MSDKNSKEFSSVLDSDGNVVADPFRNNPDSDFAFVGMPIETKSGECSFCGNPLDEIYFHHGYCQDCD
jgi:hypothetical protein